MACDARERRQKPMRKSAWLGVAVSLVFVVALGAAALHIFFMPPAPFAEPRMVTIEKGQSFRQIAHELESAGIVRNAFAFLLYAQFTGESRKVKPGDYAFRGGEAMSDVMRHLVRGDFVVVTVAIPEGLTVHEIAERLGAAGLVCAADFEQAARGGRLVRALGLMPLGAEGYLFPATYKFSPRATVDDILAAMLARFYQVLTPQVEEQMFKEGLDARRLVTMASIVEKEAKMPGERPLIAGVFYNRLRAGMPLQSDPTAEYSLAGESAAAAVRTPSAYNTYLIAGLPPGPIANPGLKSIEAALYPAHTEFLYFVARDDGTHVFSKTLKDQDRAIEAIHKGIVRAADAPKSSHGRHAE
jgi:UPF0755 protein